MSRFASPTTDALDVLGASRAGRRASARRDPRAVVDERSRQRASDAAL
jgi:hypothetical protein